VLGRHDGVSRRDEGLGELTVLKILLCAQDREIEVRHFDPRHLVVGDRSTFRMGIGECVAEPLAAWIGMALDNRHPARHGSVVFIASGVLIAEDVPGRAPQALTRISPSLDERDRGRR
jgi:hypothetical protein